MLIFTILSPLDLARNLHSNVCQMINIYCKFLAESKSERILKIRQHLAKLLTKNVVGFFWLTLYRLWFVYNMGEPTLHNSACTEIGYMNVIPKCTNSLSKYPHYENLPETYVAINDYLAESPLEGSFSHCIHLMIE